MSVELTVFSLRSKSSDYHTRVEAIRALAKMVNPDSPEKVILYRALTDKSLSSVIREGLFKDLLQFHDRDPEAIRSLTEYANLETSPFGRKSARSAIAKSLKSTFRRFQFCVMNQFRSLLGK